MGPFSSGLNSSLGHPWNINAEPLKLPGPAYFQMRDCFIFYEKNLVETFVLPTSHLSGGNLGARGEG